MWASRRRSIKALITSAPATRGLVRRFVAGETVGDAVAVARSLAALGFSVSLDRLGEDVRDAPAASAAVAGYRELIHRLANDGLTGRVELSIKLSALGQAIDPALMRDHARSICAAATAAGMTVTVDMEDHSTTDSTLHTVSALRADFPGTGAVIQASLHRSEDDCRTLAAPGSRVRLCKGAYQEAPSIAWQRRDQVRAAYLRCLRILAMHGAYPMVATHDPLLISASARLLRELAPGLQHEYQMLHGVRPDEQRRLLGAGARVRVYVPYGTQWYSYLMRRMAERPANLALVLRALVSGG
jgi:proline dehydrogenase